MFDSLNFKQTCFVISQVAVHQAYLLGGRVKNGCLVDANEQKLASIFFGCTAVAVARSG